MTADKGGRVLFLVGDFVEDLEVMIPFQTLEAFGFKVFAACPDKKAGDKCRTSVHDLEGDQTYTEKLGHNFVLNVTFNDVSVEDYDALVVPGGRSPEYLALNRSVLALVKGFSDSDKPLAAIGHGPLLLAAAGVLKGKQCTSFLACGPAIAAAGGLWKSPMSVRSVLGGGTGKVVTSGSWVDSSSFMNLFMQTMGRKVLDGFKHIIVICGDYMEDYEVMVPLAAMEALGYVVHSVCPGKQKGDICRTAIHDFEGDQTYSEKPGHNFVLSETFDEVDVKQYDGIMIPGGRAPEYLALNKRVLEMVRAFAEAKKPIASICHGQQILAAAGVLKGTKCTAYPALRPLVELAGAEWLEPDPVSKCYTHGNLVTGAAWPAHPEFIAQFIALLGTKIALE